VTDPAAAARAARLAREREHHQRIADRADVVWNWDSPSGQRRADRRAALFIELGGLAPGRRALELGCGTGLFTGKVARSGAAIKGIDLSTELLASARARTAALPNVSLTCGNAEETPYRDGTFDAVYGSSVLHHLDLERALREVARILCPGGVAVFAEPNIVNPQVAVMFHLGLTKEYFGVSPDELAFSRFRAAAALRRAGLGEVSVRPFDFLHPATPERLCDVTSRIGGVLERVPLVREIAGSLLLTARKPLTG
jgi:ubiquinone/menaquinone biosynthesis C-methylase UbiE